MYLIHPILLTNFRTDCGPPAKDVVHHLLYRDNTFNSIEQVCISMSSPTCGELGRHHHGVPSHQRGHDPRVAVAGDADRVGHLKDGVCLLLCAVEENDGALELLQLVLDLGVAVVHGHVQQQDFLQFPTHEAVLDGAPDLDGTEKKVC